MRTSTTSRGFNISYRAEGTGTPLVILCGWSMWADSWWDAGYCGRLVDDYRVIAIDRLGHGDSDKPHDPALYEPHLIVSDIVAVLDAERVDRALVWGFSMGAQNAAALAVLEPARVAALVCGGGAPLPSPDGRRERVLFGAEFVTSVEGLEAALRSLGSSAEGIAENLARNDLAAISAAMAGTADWEPAAADVQAPSLWYQGSEDDPFTPDDLELAGRLGVQTALVKGADHVASFLRIEDVLSIVEPFLEQHKF
jgi:pimeloyl-ACP methyl ester carboxylesterase